MGIIKTQYGYCYSADTRLYDYEDFEDCHPDFRKAKKVRNAWDYILDRDYFIKAYYKAQKGKEGRHDIHRFDRNLNDNLQLIYNAIYDESYIPGGYREKFIQDPKPRTIRIAPFPDRVIHHCVIGVLEPVWPRIFIDNTYACIKGRGIHKCLHDMQRVMKRDPGGTKYCLKIDVKKFYDNIDHKVLKKIIRYAIDDERLLRLLDKIIGSYGYGKGLPIGNYTSQYFANIYLTYFDHWVKEELKVQYYYRYMDDIVILHRDKKVLHDMVDKLGLYLAGELKLTIKESWQIFPVDVRSIDFVGFKQNHYNILLRKSILKRFYKKYERISKKYDITDIDTFKRTFPSEYGWIGNCSEQHSNYIINNCIENGKNKCINGRYPVGRTS